MDSNSNKHNHNTAQLSPSSLSSSSASSQSLATPSQVRPPWRRYWRHFSAKQRSLKSASEFAAPVSSVQSKRNGFWAAKGAKVTKFYSKFAINAPSFQILQVQCHWDGARGCSCACEWRCITSIQSHNMSIHHLNQSKSLHNVSKVCSLSLEFKSKAGINPGYLRKQTQSA